MITVDADAATWALALAIPVLAAAPFAAAVARARPGAALLPRRPRVPEPLVDARALSYAYPGAAEPSLRGIDLRVDPGEFVVLAGRSGSGKSTLLHACCGLVPHYHGGEVTGALDGRGPRRRRRTGRPSSAASVGLVAQDPEAQVVGATVRGEIELPLEIRGEPATARARAVEEVALALAIPDLLGRATDTLSGGELQRVALAAALVGRPRLILLDEPTSQLDPVSGDELVGLLRRLNEEWGTAVVLAEHRLERCLAAADRVIAMDGGAIALRRRAGGLPRLGRRDRPRAGHPRCADVRPRGHAPAARERQERAGDPARARDRAPRRGDAAPAGREHADGGRGLGPRRGRRAGSGACGDATSGSSSTTARRCATSCAGSRSRSSPASGSR